MESLDDIFLNAREMGDPTERAAYLAQACGADAALRARVEALLRDAGEANDFFGAEDNLPGMAAAPLTEGPGTVIGRYKLLQKIGEGGMGAVYMAEQREPVVRKVALKIIKLGMDTRQVLGRFEAERQALALMDHPNIAKILDGGATDTGRPYFVMDLVQGLPITRFCDEANLSTRDRIDLFLEVCSAIQHAHQKGIIHRDIKPANILVTLHGDKPVPKVIDFGIAKATQGRLTEKTLFTQFQHFIGTPAYMSPEQASLSGLDVDTRSDIYGLGVLLYELLTGKTPFDEKELMKVGLDEMRRTIREKEPERPSTRLTRLSAAADAATSQIANRKSQIDADLDWIVMKCLEKDRARRYETANGLASDLKRHLRNEPVIARPPSAAYRLQKSLRRNKVLFAAAGAVALTLVAGLSVSTWSLLRERKSHASETAQRLRAEEAVTMLELQRAEDLLEKDEITMGVAHLARIVRQQPTNRIAAQRLLSALTQRNFALPVCRPLAHAKRVWYAEFSPDGHRVVTAALDLTARVWDAHTGEPLTEPLSHMFRVRAAHFSPDGGSLVTIGDGAEALLWEVTLGRRLGQAMLHGKRIRTAEFSPDGRCILTASDDGTARVWDARAGEPVLQPLRHRGPVLSARFSADGQRIVTASEDKTARVWDARTGEPQGKPFQHSGGVLGAKFSPDGKWVVTVANNRSTCVWDLSSGKTLGTPLLHVHNINSVSFSRDGQRVLTVGGMAQVWNARDWAPLSRPMRHRSAARTAEFSSEGQRILSAGTDDAARLWDADSGEPLTSPLEHDDFMYSAQLSADGMFAVTTSADKTGRIWDVRLGAPRSQLLPASGRWVGAVFSPDGETIASLGEADTVRLWNARTAQPGPISVDASGVVHVRWSPDGQRVAAFCADRATRIWDAHTGAQVIAPIRHGDHITDLKFSPDGEWLATAASDGSLHQWNCRTGEPRGAPISNRERIEFFAYSPDGQRILCSDFKNDQARLHEAASGRLLAQTPEREGRVMYADFSPDGRHLITASEDSVARLWNADNLEPLAEPLRHKSSVLCVKFSRDGRRFVSASDDATARVWDTQTGQPIGEPLAHRTAVMDVEFSPDDLLVATASTDGTARLWDATTGRPVAEPFVHQGELVSVRFSPDGRRLLTVSYTDGPRAWDVPPAILPSPFVGTVGRAVPSAPLADFGRNGALGKALLTPAGLFLADLAEAVIGKRINTQGALEAVSSAGLIKIRQRTADLPRDADFTRWVEWFFADRGTRTISPYSQIGLAEYIAARADETYEIAWREALMLCPTNGIAFAQMARHHLRQNVAPVPSDIACADWASRQAVKFAPERSQPWQRRIEVMEHTGGWTQLMAEAEQVIQSQPANADAWISKSRCLTALGQFEAVAQPYNAVFWNAKGLLHEKAGQIQQAEASFAKALELAALPAAVSWDFESGRTSPNWNPIHQMANIIMERGILSFESTGGDPHLELYLTPVDGTTHHWFHVRMKNATSGKLAQVFWGTVTDPEFHEARVVEFPILPNDPQFTVYTVDMGHQAWTKNSIVRLRFDPVAFQREGGHIDIDWICLHTSSKPPADVSGSVEIANPEMRRQALSNLERLRRRLGQ